MVKISLSTMKEDLLRYMNRRSEKTKTPIRTGGPIVTISREKGCPGNAVADKLTERLSKQVANNKWRWVNKEIIERTAKELHVNTSKVNHAIYHEDKGFFTDLILSFGEKYYESDEAIKKTIGELVLEFARDGQVVVVGLGGAGITSTIDNSLHIKLYAPEKYRLKNVMHMEEMSEGEAYEYMEETDINRRLLIDYFYGFKAGNDLFHAQFNCALLSEDEIVGNILRLMQKKEMI